MFLFFFFARLLWFFFLLLCRVCKKFRVTVKREYVTIMTMVTEIGTTRSRESRRRTVHERTYIDLLAWSFAGTRFLNGSPACDLWDDSCRGPPLVARFTMPTDVRFPLSSRSSYFARFANTPPPIDTECARQRNDVDDNGGAGEKEGCEKALGARLRRGSLNLWGPIRIVFFFKRFSKLLT